MRKLSKLAVVAVMIGGVGFAGGGVAFADGPADGPMGAPMAGPMGGPMGGPDVHVSQSTTCRSHDLNLAVLSNIGLLNGLGGNLANGEGNPGQTGLKQGSEMGCNNSAF